MNIDATLGDLEKRFQKLHVVFDSLDDAAVGLESRYEGHLQHARKESAIIDILEYIREYSKRCACYIFSVLHLKVIHLCDIISSKDTLDLCRKHDCLKNLGMEQLAFEILCTKIPSRCANIKLIDMRLVQTDISSSLPSIKTKVPPLQIPLNN